MLLQTSILYDRNSITITRILIIIIKLLIHIIRIIVFRFIILLVDREHFLSVYFYIEKIYENFTLSVSRLNYKRKRFS